MKKCIILILLNNLTNMDLWRSAVRSNEKQSMLSLDTQEELEATFGNALFGNTGTSSRFICEYDAEDNLEENTL